MQTLSNLLQKHINFGDEFTKFDPPCYVQTVPPYSIIELHAMFKLFLHTV